MLFRDDPDVFVAGDLLWYPVLGSPKIRSAPDALVAFGRPKGYRGSYKQWEEAGIAPQVVFEVLSPGNTKAELNRKFAFYETYGVEEYYVYDPDHGRLEGWIRGDDGLKPIDPHRRLHQPPARRRLPPRRRPRRPQNHRPRRPRLPRHPSICSSTATPSANAPTPNTDAPKPSIDEPRKNAPAPNVSPLGFASWAWTMFDRWPTPGLLRLGGGCLSTSRRSDDVGSSGRCEDEDSFSEPPLFRPTRRQRLEPRTAPLRQDAEPCAVSRPAE